MNPRRNGSTLSRPGRSAYGVATAVILLLIPVVVLAGGNGVRDFLNFGAGVLSLVALSCSVIWGLVATDRLFLNTRQRLVAQAVHRTTAVSSVAFLLLHITVKLALDHTVLIAALIPFSLGVSGTAGLIGFGSLAGLLMIFTAITGALRSAFASPAPVAARWRAMHMLAYPAWCSALIHGLYAGRQAKPIFTILYSLCLVAVMAALALRSAPAPYKRKVADRVLALLGEGNGFSARMAREEQLTASRAARAENNAPGFAPRPAQQPTGDSFVPPQRTPGPEQSLYQTPVDPAAAGGTPGFAAAYRAVSGTPGGNPAGAAPTERFQMPMNTQPTETFPRADGSSPSGSWPIPSPPPVGEAPRSAYDPLADTGYNIPVYDNSATAAYRTSDVYDTGETNPAFGTYNTNDTYDSGPTTDVLPGAFDAPGSGEPWNAPSGGFK
ncbi:cytochrome b/b6 domain-containing protein [Streptomyces sp. NBC_01571]|uniref:cytochrome b/b6 domain-containing protein n=1 Tax=Streptomyces sp. NBC_01571 TaxID=2975883 RepID=UPI0022572905|nr:cytochrome b/b6 domain-containing protein [Streptomyces sp. NBC_01571]MCX4574912.1 cytochrome b/b6 domain-containing protein [Streptomyces sp. NBC_01571]